MGEDIEPFGAQSTIASLPFAIASFILSSPFQRAKHSSPQTEMKSPALVERWPHNFKLQRD